MTITPPEQLATRQDDGRLEPAIDQVPQLGRYQLLDRLGVGGMGTVFLAHDPELDRKVAIKLLHGGASELSHHRLQREAQAMARLSHPNVAAVYDVGWFGKELFVAMEYVPGGTLQAWLQERRGYAEVLEVFGAAGRGLAAAHGVGLVHRDFKPANVLIGEAGEAKVTDFGLVRSSEDRVAACAEQACDRADEEADTEADTRAPEASPDADASSSRDGVVLSSSSALNMQLTREGGRVGTPAYMAPEQFRGAKVDARSDQFSFCVALHEALWGCSPFAGDDFETRMRNVVHNHREPRPRTREVPEWLVPIVERGLAPEPEQRWPSMHELLAALADDPIARRKSRRRTALVLGGGLALIVGVVSAQQQREQACAEQSGAAASLWAKHQTSVDATMLAGGAAYAEANTARVHAGVEDWISRWAEQRSASCHERDAALARSSARCLSDQLDAFASLLAVIDEQSDSASVAAQAISAVAALPDPATCRSPRRFELGLGDGCSSELSLALHRLQALELAGLHGEGSRLGGELLARDDLHDCPGLEARALLGTARLELALAEPEQARPHLQRALRQANAGDDLPTARTAALTLAKLEREAQRFDVAEVWLELAQLYGDRLGARPIEVIEQLLERASLARAAGEFDDARATLREAYELLSATLGEDHPLGLRYLFEAGRLERVADRRGDALALYERARAMAEQLYGPEHPEHIEISIALAAALEQPEQAVAMAEQALAQAEAAHGRVHPQTAQACDSLGIALLRARENQRALEVFGDAIARFEQLPESSAVAFALALGHQGIALRRIGELEASEQVQRRGLELYERALGPSHPELAGPLLNLANVVDELGRVSEAVSLQRRALAIHERVDPSTITVALILDNMGMLELELGYAGEALRDIERAAAIGRALLPEGDATNIDYQTDLALAELANHRNEQARARLDTVIAVCEGMGEAQHDECVYSRGIVAEFLLDHAPEEQALALELSADAAAHADDLAAPIDRIHMRFIHARALAGSGQLDAGLALAQTQLLELDAMADRRRAPLLARRIRDWLDAH